MAQRPTPERGGWPLRLAAVRAVRCRTANAGFLPRMSVLISIIVPVYREEKNVPEFIERLRPILDAITPRYEIIFAMDPSPDRTEEVITGLRDKDPRLKLIKFSRRFG